MSLAGNIAGGLLRPRQWAIETNVLLGFVVSLCVLFIMSAGLFIGAKNFLESARWVTHSHQVLDEIAKIRVSLLESESANRAYLITDEPAYMERRNKAFQDIRTHIPTLKVLVADNPIQRSRVPELSVHIESRLAFYDYVVESKRREGLDKMRHLVKEALWREEITRVIALLNRMEQEERFLLAERSANEEERTQSLITFFTLLVATVTILQIVLFLRIQQNLTLRKQAEVDQQRLLDIINAAPDFISTGQIEGFQYLNKGGRILLDIPESQDVVGMHPSQVFTPESFQLIRERAVPTALKSGLWSGETTLLSRTGREIPISQVILAHWNKDGSFAHFSSIGRDISEQKRFTQELAQTASYDRTHGDILRLFNSTFDRTDLLSRMLAILADDHPMPVSAIYLYDEWTGKLKLETSHAAPAAVAQELMVGEGLAGYSAQQSKTIVLNAASDISGMAISTGLFDFTPATVIASPILFQENRMGVLVVATSAPITERDQQFIERVADQLGVALHNIQQYGDLKLLAEQLRLRSEEIDRKNVQLEEGNRMKSEFLATMSHELRTPLNAIIGFSEVMRDGLTGKLTDKQLEYVSDIYQSGEHLLSLINDVLDLSKIEAGRMSLDQERTDISSLLQNALSIVKERAANHQVMLKLEMEETLGQAWMDARKAKQIIYNLLSNAVKFTPEGGEVTLRARIVSRKDAMMKTSDLPGMRTPLPHAQQFLEVCVIDTGIGISADHLQQLFQPFVQIESSLSRRFEGTGLGLAMVRKLAELHGGAVAVNSLPEHGSEFRVWLPYVVSDPEQKIPPAVLQVPGAALADRSSRVLVIEDDDQAADLIRLQLEAENCQVVRAATGEIAWSLLDQGDPPDLITLDILLPGIDGWQFLSQLKENPKFSHIPVVIISIVADDTRNKGLSLGASDILQKPVSATELANALANLGLVEPRITGQAASVLVIDDDPKAVEIIASYLEPQHYTVWRSYGGNEGVQIARNQIPELIVLDLMMPEFNGFEVVEALKKDSRTAQIPIIVLTAKILSPQDRATLNGSVLQVMEKSEFNHGNFISEVRRVLKSSNSHSRRSAVE